MNRYLLVGFNLFYEISLVYYSCESKRIPCYVRFLYNCRNLKGKIAEFVYDTLYESRNIGGFILKINVFLDDCRTCPDGYILVEDIDECLTLLRTNTIEHLSLDHDLLDSRRNGLLLVQLMVENELYAERITIHSANSVGSKAMYLYLKKAQEELKFPATTKIILRPLPLY